MLDTKQTFIIQNIKKNNYSQKLFSKVVTTYTHNLFLKKIFFKLKTFF